ncbi:hypothetical protein HanPSC8_Chr15g0692151 [Helianthus annuus]|nr:hypothetical protein HanPSC8_Chr15g0692151 [Helianthus annuus]
MLTSDGYADFFFFVFETFKGSVNGGRVFKSSMHLKEIEVYWDLISCFLNHFISVEEIRSRKLMLASGLDYFHIR